MSLTLTLPTSIYAQSSRFFTWPLFSPLNVRLASSIRHLLRRRSTSACALTHAYGKPPNKKWRMFSAPQRMLARDALEASVRDACPLTDALQTCIEL